MKQSTFSISEIGRGVSSMRIYLMGIAIMMIMLFHCKIFPFSFFGYWGVDIFLLLSGYGINYSLSKKESIGSFYLRRILRIMPGALLCGIVFHYVGCAHGLRRLAVYGLNLWYVRAILFFYLISPFLYWVIQKWRLRASFLLIVISLVAGCVDLILYPDYAMGRENLIVDLFAWSLPRLPLFVLGMTLPFYMSDENIVFSYRRFIIVALIAGILPTVTAIQFRLVDNMSVVWYLNLPNVLLTPSIVLMILALAKYKNRIPAFILACFSFLGQISLEVYLIHEAMLIKWVHKLVAHSVPLVPAKLMCLFLSVVLAWFLYHACTLFRKLFMKLISV